MENSVDIFREAYNISSLVFTLNNIGLHPRDHVIYIPTNKKFK